MFFSVNLNWVGNEFYISFASQRIYAAIFFFSFNDFEKNHLASYSNIKYKQKSEDNQLKTISPMKKFKFRYLESLNRNIYLFVDILGARQSNDCK